MKAQRLRGLVGEVVERHDHAIVVCLGPDVASVDHRQIRCSPLAVEQLRAPPE